ncbi:hypothetical protein ACEN4K_10425 [Marinilactibacillus psychrotolerans]|uniref:Uncharacterized protein n=1 Tax=Marinilactibacillus psychrotolerans TaxID=191770 RepID=A0ABW8UMI1_9LACT|nr:hypothetical protein [Marinilactibacillus psychrotolerans]
MKKYLLLSSSLIALGTFNLISSTPVSAEENDVITDVKIEE